MKPGVDRPLYNQQDAYHDEAVSRDTQFDWDLLLIRIVKKWRADHDVCWLISPGDAGNRIVPSLLLQNSARLSI